MSKIVRLDSNKMRQWRLNQPMILAADGRILRAAKPEELRALDRANKTRQKLVIREQDQDCEIITGREAMARQIFEVNGECQIRAPNGFILKTVRDPNAKRYSADETRSAPDPEHCQCRDYAGRKPGKHHELCEFNPQAPPEEKGGSSPVRRVFRPTQPAAETTLSTRLADVDKPIVTAPEIPVTPVEIPSPDVCVCRKFQYPPGADKKQHHPLCEWHEKWIARHESESFLIDLETGRPERPATFDEIQAANKALIEEGSPIITIGNAKYAVGSREDGAKIVQPPEPETESVVVMEGQETADTEPPPQPEAEEDFQVTETPKPEPEPDFDVPPLTDEAT